MFRIESMEDEGSMGTAGAGDKLFRLGLTYAVGRGGAADRVSAHKWFNLAALKGSAEARRYRQELAQEMSEAEIAEAQRQAREWLSLH